MTLHILETYPERLLEDIQWLRGGARRIRDNRARKWLAQEFPNVAAEQKVVTAVLNAVALAEDKREHEVTPRRIAKFTRNLSAHAAKLAARSEFRRQLRNRLGVPSLAATSRRPTC